MSGKTEKAEVKHKVKVKFTLRTGHEGLEGE
jgi:hypothetical protein